MYNSISLFLFATKLPELYYNIHLSPVPCHPLSLKSTLIRISPQVINSNSKVKVIIGFFVAKFSAKIQSWSTSEIKKVIHSLFNNRLLSSLIRYHNFLIFFLPQTVILYFILAGFSSFQHNDQIFATILHTHSCSW